jgi:hypothetical protein
MRVSISLFLFKFNIRTIQAQRQPALHVLFQMFKYIFFEILAFFVSAFMDVSAKY